MANRLRTYNRRRRAKALRHIPLYYRSYQLWAKRAGTFLWAQHGEDILRFESGDQSGTMRIDHLSEEERTAVMFGRDLTDLTDTEFLDALTKATRGY